VSTLLRSVATRVESLTDRDRPALVRLLAADPLVNATLTARLQTVRSLAPRRLGGDVLGVRDEAGRLTAAAAHAGNLLPVGGGPVEWAALGTALTSVPRRCTSIVGRADAVTALWEQLASGWGPPRAIRASQPLLVLDRSARIETGDPRVHPLGLPDLEAYLTAATAMFTAELGVAPQAVAGAAEYRRRVAGLLRRGRGLGIVDADGAVLFKADLAAVSPDTCQVAGVWVRPDLRGQGLGTAALATVLRHALTLAPTVSLYVNDYNLAARRVYTRLGMREVATLATVLF
jgi:predicted GNAT family acetyltransferase